MRVRAMKAEEARLLFECGDFFRNLVFHQPGMLPVHTRKRVLESK